MHQEEQTAGATGGASGPAFAKTLEDLLVTLRRSSRDLAFYPQGHPQLSRSLERALSEVHAAVGARAPLQLTVSRSGFGFEGRPVGSENRQLASMAAELFVRRIQQVFVAQGVEEVELAAFLRVITSDPKQLVQQGGPGKVLAAQRVARIQVNEFDFRRLSGAPPAAGRGASRGAAEAGGPGGAGSGGSGQGAGPGGSGSGTGGSETPTRGGGASGTMGGASAGGPAAGKATGSAGAGVPSGAAGVASGAAPGGPAARQDAEGTPAPGGAGGADGQGGQGARGGATRGESKGQGPVTAESLVAALGSRRELTVGALIQRLEQEAVSGGGAAYEWAASRLEKAAGQAVLDDGLKDILAVLRVFLRHQRADTLKASVRERAAQAVERIAGGNTVTYLVEHLRAEVGASAEELSGVLVDLGVAVVPRLLSGLAAEDQGAARERLAATLARLLEKAEPEVIHALKQMDRDQAAHLALNIGEVGGEAGVALLARLVRHRDARVRCEAVRGLGRIGGASVHRHLIQALRDADPVVLETAVAFVGTAKVKMATPSLLRLAGQRTLTGQPFAVRKAAVAALGAMGDPGAISILTRLLQARTWFKRAAGNELRLTAALALLAMARPEALHVVQAGARSRRGDVRRACDAALSKAAGATPDRA